jgi:hypothetical protein
VPVLKVARGQQRSLVLLARLSRRSPSVPVKPLIAARSSKLTMWVWFRHPLHLLLRREVRPDRMRAMLLTSGRLGSKGNLRGFYVSLSEWIVDALVFSAVGSDLWLFVVFIIPRFGHVYLQAQSAACRGRVRQKQGRVCQSHDGQGQSHTAPAPVLCSSSRPGAVCGTSQRTQRRSITRYDADQR